MEDFKKFTLMKEGETITSDNTLPSSPPQTAEAKVFLKKIAKHKIAFDYTLEEVIAIMEEFAEIKSLEARNKALQEAIEEIEKLGEWYRNTESIIPADAERFFGGQISGYQNAKEVIEKLLKKPL